MYLCVCVLGDLRYMGNSSSSYTLALQGCQEVLIHVQKPSLLQLTPKVAVLVHQRKKDQWTGLPPNLY